MPREDCDKCKQMGPGPHWKDVPLMKCDVCGKTVQRILDVHHCGKAFCSLECEQSFWLDIFY